MSTVKISQLPLLSSLDANTANSLFVGVDIPTGTTGKFTAHTLAQGLFSNEILAVGTNHQNLPNTIAQFALSGESYIQTNLVNTNDGGTADIVVTANTGSGGTDAANFIDMGWANKNYQPGLEFNNIGNSVQPNDGYLYTQGTSGQNYGNLIIGSTSTFGQLKFIAGGGQAVNIVARMTSTGLVLNTQSYITFADGSTQNVAYNPGTETTQNTRLNSIETINTSQNTTIQNAFNKANTSVQNTAVIQLNTVTLTGNLDVRGSLVAFNNSTFDPNVAFIQITGSDNAATVDSGNNSYMLHITGKANSSTRLVLDSFGANVSPILVGRSGRGTASAPTATQNTDVLMRVVGNGYIGTGFLESSPTRIDFVAAENFSNTNTGTQIQFWNTPVSSNTIQKIATFNTDSVSFTGIVNSQKGFVYSPTVYPGAQTAITIDVSNNSLVRAQTSTGLTVTLSNLMAGKEVISWITNTANSAQTFTHGCSALNSTINATTYNIPSTSTILVRYMCIDTTTQNTFVAITKA